MTDYLKRAEDMLSGPPEEWTAAVAYATMALAKQQRIANLIAYSSHRREYPKAGGAIDLEIREGLWP